MMKGLAALLALWAAPLAAEELRIGTESGYAPYVSMENGERVGLDVDLMAAVCARGAYECAWVEVPFAELIPRLAGGEYDVAVGGIGSNPERDLLVDWTTPYRKVSDVIHSAFAGYGPVADLQTAPIGVLQGSTQESVLAEHDYNAVPFATFEAAMEAMTRGEVAAVFAPALYFQVLSDAGETDLLILEDLHSPSTGTQIAVSKDRPALRQALDDILGEMSADGSLAAINAKWFPHDTEDDA